MKTELFLHIIYVICQRQQKSAKRISQENNEYFSSSGGGGGAHQYIGYISICATVKGRVSNTKCPKGKKSLRYHRKTIKDRVKKTTEPGKSLSSFARGKLQKKRENILSENRRPEMMAKNGRFPGETGGLESRPIYTA